MKMPIFAVKVKAKKKRCSSRPKKDCVKMVWIVTASDLRVRKVEATFTKSRSKWSYDILKDNGTRTSWTGLSPYNPTWGTGDWNFWGDGPHYRSKAEAIKAQKKIITIKKKQLLEELENLKKKRLKELNDILKEN